MIKAENMQGLLNLLTLMVHTSGEYCENNCGYLSVNSEGFFDCCLFKRETTTTRSFLCLRCRDCLTYFE